MVRPILILVACVVLELLAAPVAGAQTREKFEHGGRSREAFLYVPENVKPDIQAPLLVLLHGSGRDGASLVNPWRDLAREEGLVLVGPNATDRAGWNMKSDGPDFLEALVTFVQGKQPIDRRRVYVFGHSAGAIHGLYMGLLESEYFAAVAVHAGAIPREDLHLLDYADRKIPMAIWVGSNDRLFPLTAVQSTVDALKAKGIPVQLVAMPNHDHNYYLRAGTINQEAWNFLHTLKLDSEPKFKRYQ